MLILDAGSAVNSYSFAPISHIPTKKAESSWNIENGSQQTSTSIRAKISVKAKHILNICVKLDKNLPKLFNSCLKVALKKNFMFYFSTVRFFHFLNFLSFWKWKYNFKSIFSVYSYIPITEQDVVMHTCPAAVEMSRKIYYFWLCIPYCINELSNTQSKVIKNYTWLKRYELSMKQYLPNCLVILPLFKQSDEIDFLYRVHRIYFSLQ